MSTETILDNLRHYHEARREYDFGGRPRNPAADDVIRAVIDCGLPVGTAVEDALERLATVAHECEELGSRYKATVLTFEDVTAPDADARIADHLAREVARPVVTAKTDQLRAAARAEVKAAALAEQPAWFDALDKFFAAAVNDKDQRAPLMELHDLLRHFAGLRTVVQNREQQAVEFFAFDGPAWADFADNQTGPGFSIRTGDSFFAAAIRAGAKPRLFRGGSSDYDREVFAAREAADAHREQSRKADAAREHERVEEAARIEAEITSQFASRGPAYI